MPKSPRVVISVLAAAVMALVGSPASALPVQKDRIWYTQSPRTVLTLSNGQSETIRSVLNVRTTMRYGDFIWNANGVPNGKIWIRIDLAHQILSVFREGNEIGSAVILYGAQDHPTPLGVFAILDMQKDYFSKTYRAPMPFMLRLTQDGVSIHGSNVREGWATHGCIGVPIKFAQLVFSVAHKGDLVAIR